MSHHRQHAKEFLLEASSSLQTCQKDLAQYIEEGGVLTALGSEQMGFALLACADMANILTQATALIESGDLDKVRGLLNQPQPTGPSSASIFVGRIQGHTVRVIQEGGDPTYILAHSLIYARGAWWGVDHALWHVNDAIREEIYNDPAFAEVTP